LYLWHSVRRKNGKQHTYWRLVRAPRRGGKVVQETVAQLGELDADGRAQARCWRRKSPAQTVFCNRFERAGMLQDCLKTFSSENQVKSGSGPFIIVHGPTGYVLERDRLEDFGLRATISFFQDWHARSC
jgi:hypothetical protein